MGVRSHVIGTQLTLLLFLVVILGGESRASCMQHKYFASELHSLPKLILFLMGVYERVTLFVPFIYKYYYHSHGLITLII